MDNWIFNEGFDSYLDLKQSKSGHRSLERFVNKAFLAGEVDYFRYVESLNIFVISGDPASIGITEISGDLWIVRSLGRPDCSVSALAQLLLSKRDVFTKEECIEFDFIKVFTKASLYAWNSTARQYECNVINGLPEILINSAVTYMYRDMHYWCIITIISRT